MGEAAGVSLWDLHKQFEGIDAAAALPASLDARRAAKTEDGLAHCADCGGHLFSGAIAFRADGSPAQILTPQRCIGCGALRQASWP